MRVLSVNNVGEALWRGLRMLKDHGVRRSSRNGTVLQMPESVATVYEHPQQRVLFWAPRDANPFFHFYESLWMLAGRNDVAPLRRYVRRMAEFSDDGKVFNAAYGYRWRHATKLGVDQLDAIVENLRKNVYDRRQVLQIWSLKHDLSFKLAKAGDKVTPGFGEHPAVHLLDVNSNGVTTKDAACNLTATFQIGIDDKLDMTVFCRSNDAIWGCWGANAVHYSMLHEYMATRIGVRIGRYTQISVNLHMYEKHWSLFSEKEDLLDQYDLGLQTYPIMRHRECWDWDADVRNFVTDDGAHPVNLRTVDPFFCDVASPLVLAHDAYKDEIGEEKFVKSLFYAANIKADDWRKACVEWLHRRYAQWKRDHDDGVRYG